MRREGGWQNLLRRSGVFIGVFLVASMAVQAQAALRVVSPPDGVWVSQSKLFLAGTAPAAAGSVKISGVSGGGKIKIQAGGVFGTAISLDRGMNTIRLEAGAEKLQVKVFYTPDARKKAPPKGFKRFYVHSKPGELNCQECHRFRKGVYDFKRLVPARSNCTTKCHQDKGKAKYVHGPVGAGICISCHSPHGTVNPSFVPREGGDLCTICHQGRKEEFEQNVIHSPVEEGCSDCHNPHESPNRYQLKGEGGSVSSLCFTCHEEGIFMKENKHGPVEEGDCIACHRPHSSANASLLIATPEGGALCFECHEDRKEEFTMEYLHAPAEEDCAECHDPHSAKAEYMLKESGGALCAMCHEDYNPEIYEAINNAKTKHPPVSDGECVKCHRPHSSSYASLLNESMESLCLSCHADLSDIIAESKNRHGPVQTGDCAACHNVHGSEYAKLLARFYPLNFYSEYDVKKYDLCFGCHNKDIAKTRNTETLTNFRDGSRNLHFLHVNMKKGRTCTACHDAHASNQAKHIRYEVPFGAWSYPINITKTATGGSCVVGCHAPKKYDRKKPVISSRR